MIALNRVVVTGMGAITQLGKAIRESIVPPTINTNNPETGYAGKFNLTLGESQSREIRYAMNNTFGFGGHIASTIFKNMNLEYKRPSGSNPSINQPVNIQ